MQNEAQNTAVAPITVSGGYYVQACGDYVGVTVDEIFEAAGMAWVKVSGCFPHSGSEQGITFRAAELLTRDELLARTRPATFIAKYPGKCANCGGAVRAGEAASRKYRSNIRVARNPVIHDRCFV